MAGTNPTTGLAEQVRLFATRVGNEVKTKAPLTAVQTGAPASPVPGQLWWDTDEPVLTGPLPAQGGLTLVENAGANVTTPASNQAVLYSDDGTALLIKDDTGTIRTVGSIVPDQQLSADYTTTMPTVPAAGIKMFSRWRARRLPSFVGPTGQDSRLQPFLGSNKVSRVTAVYTGSGATSLENDAIATTILSNAGTTPTAVIPTTTSLSQAMVRARLVSTTTAQSAGELRGTNAQWFLSSTANMGGFYLVVRFSIGVSAATGSRGFIGMSATTAALAAGVDPSTYLNMVGLGWNAADTSMRVMSNDGTGTATQTAVFGANYATGTSGTNAYEFSLYAPSGAGLQVHWSLTRINDGAMVSSGATPITTDLPALNTLLTPHVFMGNGANAASVGIDLQSLYIESDN